MEALTGEQAVWIARFLKAQGFSWGDVARLGVKLKAASEKEAAKPDDLEVREQLLGYAATAQEWAEEAQRRDQELMDLGRGMEARIKGLEGEVAGLRRGLSRRLETLEYEQELGAGQALCFWLPAGVEVHSAELSVDVGCGMTVDPMSVEVTNDGNVDVALIDRAHFPPGGGVVRDKRDHWFPDGGYVRVRFDPEPEEPPSGDMRLVLTYTH